MTRESDIDDVDVKQLNEDISMINKHVCDRMRKALNALEKKAAREYGKGSQRYNIAIEVLGWVHRDVGIIEEND